MRRVSVLVSLILFSGLVLSLDTSLNCPNQVKYNKEFICTVDISNSEDTYDLKVYIKGDGKGINQIWEKDEFRRADWYLKGFIDKDGEFETKLIIHKDYSGEAEGEFKLRDSSGKTVISEKFEIAVDRISNENEDDQEESEENSNKKDDKKENEAEEEEVLIYEKKKEIIKKEEPKKVINLNSHDEIIEEQVVYRSKNEKIKDYMTYAFFVFLILIIGVLLIERRW